MEKQAVEYQIPSSFSLDILDNLTDLQEAFERAVEEEQQDLILSLAHELLRAYTYRAQLAYEIVRHHNQELGDFIARLRVLFDEN